MDPLELFSIHVHCCSVSLFNLNLFVNSFLFTRFKLCSFLTHPLTTLLSFCTSSLKIQPFHDIFISRSILPCLRLPFCSEKCHTPPTTPLDELALKRHRFFEDLIDAAHEAIDHRVRFDPLGPFINEIPSRDSEKLVTNDSKLKF